MSELDVILVMVIVTLASFLYLVWDANKTLRLINEAENQENLDLHEEIIQLEEIEGITYPTNVTSIRREN